MGRKKRTITISDNGEILTNQTNEEKETGEGNEPVSQTPFSNSSTSESEDNEKEKYEKDLADLDNIIKTNQQKNAVSEQKEEKRGRKSNAEKARIAITVPGSLFVRVHTWAGASALSMLDSYISKKNYVPSDLLGLDEQTIQELATVAELAMKEMKVEENPVAAFYIMWGTSMLSQYMNMKAMIRTLAKENPDMDITQMIEQKMEQKRKK